MKCDLFENLIEEKMNDLLQSPQLDIPLRERAKFEGWLKVELAAALEGAGFDVTLEKEISTRKRRADLFLGHKGRGIYLELKTVNTSYRFPRVRQCDRPITRNFEGVCKDIQKLGDVPTATSGYMVFAVFPVSADKKERCNKLCRYLERVFDERAAVTAEECCSGFIGRDTDWGVAWYVGRVNAGKRWARR